MTTPTPAPTSALAILVPMLGGRARIETERTLTAGLDDAWSALTDPERLDRWMAPVTREGSRFRIGFGDGEDDVVAGEILACEAPSRLVVSWEVAGTEPSRVEAALEEKGSATLLRLVHSGLDTAGARGLGAGWQAHLSGLEAHLAGQEPAQGWMRRFTDALGECTRQLPPGLAAVGLEGGRGSLRFERRLETDLADAWSVVTEPDRIARWFAPVTVEGSGEGARWRTYWDDGAEYAEGVVRRCEPQRLVEVSWTASDDADRAGSRVRVTLEPDGDGVLLVLEHDGLVPADLVQYGAGWQSFLEEISDGRPGYDWAARYRELKPIYERMLAS